MHRPSVRFYLEGEQDVLFEMAGFGHQCREGDLVSFETDAGVVEYKVESSKLELTPVKVGTPGRDSWAHPRQRVEVTVVP